MFLVARPGGLFGRRTGPGRRRTRPRRPDVPRLFQQRQRRELQPRRPDDRRRAQPGFVAGSWPSKATRAWRGSSSSSIRVELARAAGLAGDRGLGAGRRLQQRQALPADRLAGRFRLTRASRTPSTMRRPRAGSIQARRPAVQAQARKLGDGTFLIVYDNVAKAPGRRRTEDGVRPGDAKAGQSEGGRPDDPGRAGERRRSRA